MMNCENCGKVIADNAVICPNCGAATPSSMPRPDQPRYTPPQSGYPPQQNYMPPPQSSYPPPQQGYMPPPQSGYPPYQPGYPSPQQGYMPPPQPGYMAQQQNYGYQQQPPMYPPQGVNVTVVNNAPPKNNTPIIVEVLLSLFGIYGVGWLMAGETTTGILLLIGSFVIYWPVLILIAVFTLGLGIACDFPLGIAAIVINAILLNNTLNRKATQITMMQTRR
jgi:TM2 domain-containing membrane protein YozV